ncbi:hypothetical protein D4740_01155 [Actinomyces sp. 2119]|nr:hypothetical protein D4740_01155 [Actinomyces sp. 2119]
MATPLWAVITNNYTSVADRNAVTSVINSAPTAPSPPTKWAYTTEAEPAVAYNDWLRYYNHHRPHTSIDGQTPGTTRTQSHRKIQLGMDVAKVWILELLHSSPIH